MNTRLYLDCEFTGLHQNTSLISIALVSGHEEEDHRRKAFYGINSAYDKSQVNTWIQRNVIDNLEIKLKEDEKLYVWLDMEHCQSCPDVLCHELRKWIKQFDEVEIWCDVLAYDWVLFCELFGGAFKIPKNVYYIPFDFGTLLRVNNIDPDISRSKLAKKFSGINIREHNALWDAFGLMICIEDLIDIDPRSIRDFICDED